MSSVRDSVEYAEWWLSVEYPIGTPAQQVTDALVDLLHYCDDSRKVSWQRCLAAAMAQHQKEVREQSDATPLPSK